MGDIIRDLQLPRCPVRTPARPAPRGPHPFVLPTARPAPARTKLAPGPLGPLCGLHAVPGWRALGPGSRAARPSGPLPASAGAPRGSGAGGRAAAGPGRARGGLRAGLTPCWPRCARARTPARGERAQGRRAARLPRPAPTSPAVAVRGARSGGAGRARCGGPAGAGAGPGAASREPGWISRFHPDSPSALPADSVLLGDHVTRAAFDPGLGAGRGRGPGPEGCQTRDP